MNQVRLAKTVSFMTVLLTTVNNGAPAQVPSSAASLPRSQFEQTARLSGLAGQNLGRRIFPHPVESIAPAPYYQRDYRTPWTNASDYERIQLAEKIGNQGRGRFAAEQGWIKLGGSQDRGIVQGPDSSYWDPYSAQVRVLEAKGGTSPVSKSFGSKQGTNRNAIRSAEFVLKSANASPAQKLGAARVIKVAQQNRLQTAVVRTPHSRGKPDAPRLEGQWDRANVSREAVEIERELVRRKPELAQTFKAAGKAHASDMLKYRAGQGVAILGLAGAAGLGCDAYQQSIEAWSMFQDSTLRGTALPYLQTGMAVGRVGEATTLGLGSAAQLGILGRGGFSVVGRVAGKWFLPVAIGVEALSAGTTYYQYSIGRISQRDFYRRSSGPAIFAVFTTGGAIIGGIAGAPAGGVGAAPGAAAGAGIGALVAVPFQFAADWTWNWYYRKFDEQQRRAVDVAVERLYDLRE